MTPGDFHGYASVFGEKAWIGPTEFGFWEQIAPTAFDAALRRGDDTRLLFNHDANYVLARTASGTARLSKDRKGLVVAADLADTTAGTDVRKMLRRGDVSGMSFAFSDAVEDVVVQEDGTYLRTVTDLRLSDVSIVVYPAYDGTSARLVSDLNVLVARHEAQGRRLRDDDTRRRVYAPPPRVAVLRRRLELERRLW